MQLSRAPLFQVFCLQRLHNQVIRDLPIPGPQLWLIPASAVTAGGFPTPAAAGANGAAAF